MRHFRHHKKEPQNLIKPQIQQTLLQKVALKKEDHMIQLTEKLVMTADKHCYIVGEPKQRPGRPFEIKEPKYYSTAAQAVQGALYTAMRQSVEDGSITTPQDFIKELERRQAAFQTMIAPLKGG